MRYLYVLIAISLCPLLSFAQVENPSQTIRGTVVDKTMQTPLIGATILLVGSDPQRGTISDETGRFRIDKVPIGRQEIKVIYLSYKETSVDILVNSDKETVLTISLEEDIIHMDEVKVTSTRGKSPANNSLIVNDQDKILAEWPPIMQELRVEVIREMIL